MKILVIAGWDPKRAFLVDLYKRSLVKRVKRLVDDGKHSQAIISALAKGRIEKAIENERSLDFKAELILSAESARWDLTK